MTNSADPDQLASDLHCLQRQGISVISRTRIKRRKKYKANEEKLVKLSYDAQCVKRALMLYVNMEGPEQHVHLCSLI